MGTIQLHNDAFVITLRIGGYKVKRCMVDQGSGVENIYPNLYKGLALKPEDLSPYEIPLIDFDGKIVIPRGMIKLPVQTGREMVEVDFIIIDAYAFYTAILARPWLHAMGVVSSTLHVKVMYRFSQAEMVLTKYTSQLYNNWIISRFIKVIFYNPCRHYIMYPLRLGPPFPNDV